MKKRIFAITIVCISLVTFFFCNRKYTNQELIGTYVNNFNEVTPSYVLPPEAPRISDTLILLENGNFTSKAFGKGNYKTDMNGSLHVHLKYVERSYKMDTINGSLRFDLPYKEVKAGYEMRVRPKGLFGGVPVLEINSDGDYYYKKIK